jgi:hypothetical protein
MEMGPATERPEAADVVGSVQRFAQSVPSSTGTHSRLAKTNAVLRYTNQRSRTRESCISGSVRGTPSDRRPYSTADKQATIMLSVITDHGRATPLVWLTVDKCTLKNNRSLYEHRVLVRLAELLPPDVKVCVVADRGFGDQNLYKVLTEELYFDYVIRFRGNIAVTAVTGETRTAAAWVRPGGRARVLRGAAVTADRYAVGTVVCVQDPDMKQAWCLAASSTAMPPPGS